MINCGTEKVLHSTACECSSIAFSPCARNSPDQRAHVSTTENGFSCLLLSVLISNKQGFAADPQTKTLSVVQLYYNRIAIYYRIILLIIFFLNIWLTRQHIVNPQPLWHGTQLSVQHHTLEGDSSPCPCHRNSMAVGSSTRGLLLLCCPTMPGASRAAGFDVLEKVSSEPRLHHTLNIHHRNSAQCYLETVFFCAPAVFLLCSKMK